MSPQRRARWFTGLLLALFSVSSGGCGDERGATSAPLPSLDRFGGWTGIEFEATGRFRLEQRDQVWWLVTPEGHAFFSAGVSATRPEGDYSPALGRSPYQDNILALYGSQAAWATVNEARLRQWGFNTIGAWSRFELFHLPYTAILEFHASAPAIPGWPAGVTGVFLRDYFSPEFEAGAAATALQAQACAQDPFCIGVFTDNELPWGPGVLESRTDVDAYMTLPSGAPGKRALQEFFASRYSTIEAFNAAWDLHLEDFGALQELTTLSSNYRNEPEARRQDRLAFLAKAAERYYQVAHDALRAVDPQLLILGTRFFSTLTTPGVIAAAGPYIDIASVNDYDYSSDARELLFRPLGRLFGYLFLDDSFADLATIHELTGKPVMITEFFYRIARPDVASLPPGFPTVDTQVQRAEAYEHYMNEVLVRPFVVGAHWFKHADQPVTGRSDGENQLIGLVDIDDIPYPELTARMMAINLSVYERRAAIAPAQLWDEKAPIMRR